MVNNIKNNLNTMLLVGKSRENYEKLDSELVVHT